MSWELPTFRRRPIRSRQYREAARNQKCTLMTSWCTHEPATVVLAHADWQTGGKGMGLKADDLFGVDACTGCHDWLHHAKVDVSIKKAMFLDALMRTQRNRHDRNLLQVAGAED